MSKVSFTNLKLKVNNKVSKINIADGIEVLNYLPIDEKYSLIMVALQKSKEDNYFNPIKLEMFFNLNIIYMYTNISFTAKQREDESKLYDILESNNLINEVISNIPSKEYESLHYLLEKTLESLSNYNQSIWSLFGKLIDDLPKNAEAVAKIVDNFNPDKYQAVIDFARVANGGRPID